MEYTNEVLGREFERGRLAQSYLLVGADSVQLYEIGRWFASKFNPANVFWLRPREGEKTIQVEAVGLFMEKAMLACVGNVGVFGGCWEAGGPDSGAG